MGCFRSINLLVITIATVRLQNVNMTALKDKIALVTGATSGIGLSIARSFAGSGMTLIINGLGHENELETIRLSIEQEYAVDVMLDTTDLRHAGNIETMLSTLLSRYGRIDVLCNNAGVQHVAPIETLSTEKWDQILAINLSAAFHTTRLLLPSMKAIGWGRIINIASVHGFRASPYKAAYISAKHGLVGFTKATAVEVATQGITCNAICPGYVDTPLVENQIESQMCAHNLDRAAVVQDIMLARQPSKQFVEASDIGALALFLCSPQAASITGTAMPSDGGWSAF